jgi:hypothetical protein
MLDEAAGLVLEGIPDDPPRRWAQPMADFERSEFLRLLNSTLPADWIRELSGTYVTEAAHELRTLSFLIRAGHVAASIEVVVRAAVERIGRTNWVLDVDEAVDPHCRAKRASFETLVSFQRYRTGVDMIRADSKDRKRVANDMRKVRTLVEEWFDIEKPLAGTGAAPTPLVADWIIEGETYPTYESLSRWAIADRSISDGIAKGTYAALSAFSHPSFVAARELQLVRDNRSVYEHPVSYVERLLRLALFGLSDALKHWIAYFDWDHDRIVFLLDDIADRWDARFPPGSAEQ